MAIEDMLPAPGICGSCKRKPCVKIFADTSGLAGHPIAIHAGDGVPSQCPAELREAESTRIWRVSSLSMMPLAVSGTPGSRVLYPEWTSPIAGRIRALTQILRPKANTAARTKGLAHGAAALEEGMDAAPEEIKPTLTNGSWVFLAQPKSLEGEERALASASPLDFVWCKVDTEGLMPGDTISFTVFLKGKGSKEGQEHPEHPEHQEDIKVTTVTGRVGENRKDESAVAKFQIPQEVAGKALIPDVDKLYFVAKQFAAAIEVKSALLPVAPPPPLVLAVETLPSVTFAHDSSALAPAQKSRLVQLRKSMDDWFARHPDGHVALFGHADLIGEEAYNKTLSERRAASVLAAITHDASAWEGLYQKEAWGLGYVQELLLALEFDPGPLDGISGPKTEAAIRAFQKSEGLAESGQNDAGLRKALFTAYFQAAFGKPIASSCLQSINGHAFAGCSEFNPVDDTQAASVVNRRVTVVLLDPKADNQLVFPCASGDIKPCKQQTGKSKSQRHCMTFKCCFYDELIRQEKNEGEIKGELNLPDYDPGVVAKAEPSGCAGEGNEISYGEIVKVGWSKKTLLAWDESDLEEMKVSIAIESTGDISHSSITVEVFQLGKNENHLLLKTIGNLAIKNNKIMAEDGKELEIKIEWHDSIYDYGSTQYFCSLIMNESHVTSGLQSEDLLQMKHYDGIIANPSGDLPGAEQEGAWLAVYLRKNGAWYDGAKGQLISNGHQVTLYNSVSNTGMKSLLERNKYLHHQSSHGGAYCWCSGQKSYFEETTKIGPDGVNEYACPLCNRIDGGVGVINLRDESNDFFRSNVKALARSPKVLVLANCCLTAITPAYANEWVKKGTKWYIGWAVPVGDEDAVDFAKAFYRRWMENYEMDSAMVRKAFNDVKAPYEIYRPRIFGK